MRYWLIGCGVFLLIGVGLVLFLGNIFYKQAKESYAKAEEVITQYEILDANYAFQRPTDGILTASAASNFFACRGLMMTQLNGLLAEMEDEENSGIAKVSLLFDLYPSLGLSHVEALQTVAISPAEYRWILFQVLAALRHAEAEVAPQALKDLRRDLDQDPSFQEQSRTVQISSESESGTFTSGQDGPGPLLPQLDPYQIHIPHASIEVIIAHREDLLATATLLYYFDFHFKATYAPSLHSPANNGVETLPPPVDEGN